MQTLRNENLARRQSPPTKNVPRIAVTMGDAAGIGPEIILKALADEKLREICLPVVIGDARFLRNFAERFGLFDDFTVVKKNESIPENETRPVIYDLGNLTEDFECGADSGVCGKAAAEYIETAVELWKNGAVEAISTAPISKKALALGGYNYPGHTEFLAELTATDEFAMSFFAGDLRVVLLSTHLSLTDALKLVKKDNLVNLILFTAEKLEKLLHRKVKIAAAGLNPHASEGGMFGSEEADEIIPAVTECRDAHGVDVYGPFSPDTIFLRAFRGEFDAVIACYHDQATIPVKCLSFGASVNVTLGLPLIRTSVDHGTAFDIAEKNAADASSMIAAVALAADLSIINSSN